MKNTLVYLLGLVVLALSVGASADPAVERLLGTKQETTYPFSYNMSCNEKGCTTKEGKFFTFAQLVDIFPNGYDYSMRQDYFCHNGLCFDNKLSPVGRDNSYLSEEDAVIGYAIRIVGGSNGRPMINIGDCSGEKCYVDKDPDKVVSLRYLMNQVPTLLDDAGQFDCSAGICEDKQTGWVVGVDQEDRMDLIK